MKGTTMDEETYLYKSRVRQFISTDTGSTKAMSRFVELEPSGYGDATLYIGDTYITSASIWPRTNALITDSLETAITDAERIRDFVSDFIKEMKDVLAMLNDETIASKFDTDGLIGKDELLVSKTVSED